MPDINFRLINQEELRASEEGVRKMTFVASDGTRDSAGTVLNPKGWDLARFNKNGIIGYQHKVYGAWDDTANPDNVIGKGFAYVKGSQLLVDVEFEPEGMNELADKVWRKLIFGTLKAVSVGFQDLGGGHWGEGDEAFGKERATYYYENMELLEVSVVNIPANPNALRRSIDEDEMKRLAAQAEVKAEPEPEPQPEPQPEPEPEPQQDPEPQPEVKASELDLMTQIARAALLS